MQYIAVLEQVHCFPPPLHNVQSLPSLFCSFSDVPTPELQTLKQNAQHSRQMECEYTDIGPF